MTRLEPVLAWAILALGLAVLWLGLGVPVLRHLDATQGEIARMTTLAERYEMAARVPAPAAGSIEAALLMPAATEAQTQAALQERVKAILAVAGCVLTGLQPQTPEAAGPWRAMPLSVQFTGDIGALQRALHGLESARPMIAVAAVQMRPRGRPGAGTGLDIALDLAAFAPRTGPGTGP
ncbi:type II secretion system protein GspM [Desertibaculum subflavum]|uniref:type II secretion system protein GspM n=1 Tax=Desertibaculum subflavum TaxID=2268458 RepID=UPI000E671A87